MSQELRAEKANAGRKILGRSLASLTDHDSLCRSRESAHLYSSGSTKEGLALPHHQGTLKIAARPGGR